MPRPDFVFSHDYLSRQPLFDFASFFSRNVFGIWSLIFSVALSFDGDLVSIVRESVEGALGQQRIVEEGDPLVGVPLAGDDGREACRSTF